LRVRGYGWEKYLGLRGSSRRLETTTL